MANRKPSDKFPLWLHPSGQWCKKLRGRNHYFGTDRDGALKRYVAEWPNILAGRPVHHRPTAGTVADLVNHFLTAKRSQVTAGELTERGWAEYYATSELLVQSFGAGREVGTLRPDDFASLRAKLSKRLGPVALAVAIQKVRTVFKYGYDSELLAAPVRFGPGFAKPSRRTVRLAKADRGPRLIPAADIRKLIEAAGPPLDAMLLLAINCGFGQTDCSELPRSALVRPGWIDFRRPKTGQPRRCPLWPETVDALARVEAARPDPADDADDRLVFLTRYGRPFVRFSAAADGRPGCRSDSIGREFGKLVRRVGVAVPGGFYTLRHVHRTVADEVLDPVAAGLIMGHVDEGIAATYREHVNDGRLTAVTEHVRKWLAAGGK